MKRVVRFFSGVLILLTAGCGHVAVKRVATADGEGYELRCSKKAKCVRRAEKICPEGYDTTQEGDAIEVRARCSDGRDLWATCWKDQDCVRQVRQQCAGAFEVVDRRQEHRLTIACADSETESAEEVAAPSPAPRPVAQPKGPLTPAEIAKAALPSVVTLHVRTSEGGARGSGFVVAPHTVATNFHVVRGATSIQLQTNTKQVFEITQIVAVDPDHDLALLSVPGFERQVLPLASVQPAPGESVVVLGSPKGFEGSVSTGVVAAVRAEGVQFTAPISPGSSGGPVLNDHGQVIAVSASVYYWNEAENLNFGVPGSVLDALLRRPSNPMSVEAFGGASSPAKARPAIASARSAKNPFPSGVDRFQFGMSVQAARTVCPALVSGGGGLYLCPLLPAEDVLQVGLARMNVVLSFEKDRLSGLAFIVIDPERAVLAVATQVGAADTGDQPADCAVSWTRPGGTIRACWVPTIGQFVLRLFAAENGANSTGSCASALVGRWLGTTRNDAIVTTGDGSFSYSGPDGCSSQGTFNCPPVGAVFGGVRVSVGSSSGGLCLPPGNFTCAFTVKGRAMEYDCTGGGALKYKRM